MSESDIDMDRCLLGIDDEKACVPEITWTNCAEQMPPDDDTLVIIRWGVLEQHRIEPGSDSHKLLEEKEVFNNRYWTLYTSEKWEVLKK